MRLAREDEFYRFLEKHNKVIMKPVRGGQGRGCFVMNRGEKLDCFAKYGQYIAEEFIRQTPAMAELNASSVNTVRVWTFKRKIIGTAVRMGNGGCVDNLHSKGVCGYLDEHTGIITNPCIDNSLNQYIFHPGSRVKLVGFEIPNWSLLLDKIAAIADVIPEVAYVGWDIAILDDDIDLIEGNFDPGHDLMQMVIQNGCWHKIA